MTLRIENLGIITEVVSELGNFKIAPLATVTAPTGYSEAMILDSISTHSNLVLLGGTIMNVYTYDTDRNNIVDSSDSSSRTTSVKIYKQLFDSSIQDSSGNVIITHGLGNKAPIHSVCNETLNEIQHFFGKNITVIDENIIKIYGSYFLSSFSLPYPMNRVEAGNKKFVFEGDASSYYSVGLIYYFGINDINIDGLYTITNVEFISNDYVTQTEVTVLEDMPSGHYPLLVDTFSITLVG